MFARQVAEQRQLMQAAGSTDSRMRDTMQTLLMVSKKCSTVRQHIASMNELCQQLQVIMSAAKSVAKSDSPTQSAPWCAFLVFASKSLQDCSKFLQDYDKLLQRAEMVVQLLELVVRSYKFIEALVRKQSETSQNGPAA